MHAITINTSDRVCLFGRTGSGKTTLAKYLLSRVNHYLVLDAKHTFSIPNIPIVEEYNRSYDKQIIRADYDAETEVYDDALLQSFAIGDIVVYLDETTLINPNTRTINPPLGRLIRTGRERSIGVWLSSQRPKDIPSVVFTEAEHFFLFQLQFKADREKVVDFTSERLEPALDSIRGHDAVYYNVLSDRIVRLKLRLRR